jgi:hypothetical protein
VAEQVPRRCKVMGHRWHFHVDDAVVLWTCERCGHTGGRHERASHTDARRFAQTLNRGRPRPPTGLLAALAGTGMQRPKRRPPDDG